MDLQQIKETDKKYFMNTFGDRTPVAFVSGRGMDLTDTKGEVYKDFFAGIAVTALGHSHPRIVKTVKEQAEKLLHTSSLYYIESQAKLAKELAARSCCDRAYFANSGAEANEGAIKLAKIYHYKKGTGRTDIITLQKSFHGRTLAAVAATGQEKYQKPYAPLVPGFTHVPINDIEAFKNAVTDKTAAFMTEFIQGESGVHPLKAGYIKEVFDICRKNGILIIDDEIQTGVGRTGKMFAYQHYGVEPDIITMAKALGGGVPCGAVLAKEEVCAFEPGDHGGTFGGNHLATTVALEVLKTIDEENLIYNAEENGRYFAEKLRKIDGVSDVRGKGLMIGVAVLQNAKETVRKMFEKKYLLGAVGDDTLRILPPLIVTKEDIDKFCIALEECI